MDKVQSIRNLSLIIKTVFMERKLFLKLALFPLVSRNAYATTIEYIVKIIAYTYAGRVFIFTSKIILFEFEIVNCDCLSVTWPSFLNLLEFFLAFFFVYSFHASVTTKNAQL